MHAYEYCKKCTLIPVFMLCVMLTFCKRYVYAYRLALYYGFPIIIFIFFKPHTQNLITVMLRDCQLINSCSLFVVTFGVFTCFDGTFHVQSCTCRCTTYGIRRLKGSHRYRSTHLRKFNQFHNISVFYHFYPVL